MSTYKLLDHSFRRAKWHYRLLERNGMAAIYEQRASAKPDKISGYAVARIRRVEGKTMPNGNKIPPREIFPSPSEFGFNGWYYMSNPESKKMAYEQYHKLIHKLGQVIPEDKSPSDEKGNLTSLDEEEEDDLGDDMFA